MGETSWMSEVILSERGQRVVKCDLLPSSMIGGEGSAFA